MSKVLYPKSVAVAVKKANELPLHVVYSDPENPAATVVRHYSSDFAVKAASWWHCRFVGLTKVAVLYTTKELAELAADEVKAVK